jgi:bifunctional DNA-binding transcriptional regulator/antitoxin component of YhaV-PrlF toxin-antitoxin module
MWGMAMERVTQIDKSGALNLPKEIIEPLGCKGDDKLMVFSSKNAIVIKRIASASLPERFERLADEVETQYRKCRVAEKDVEEAVTWARK